MVRHMEHYQIKQICQKRCKHDWTSYVHHSQLIETLFDFCETINSTVSIDIDKSYYYTYIYDCINQWRSDILLWITSSLVSTLANSLRKLEWLQRRLFLKTRDRQLSFASALRRLTTGTHNNFDKVRSQFDTMKHEHRSIRITTASKNERLFVKNAGTCLRMSVNCGPIERDKWMTSGHQTVEWYHIVCVNETESYMRK